MKVLLIVPTICIRANDTLIYDYSELRHSRMFLARIRRAGVSVAFAECRTLTETIALRRYLPGLGPSAGFLSLLRQRKESKKYDPGVALHRAACKRLRCWQGYRLCNTKNGKVRKLACGSNIGLSISISCIAQSAVTHGNYRSQKQRQHDRYSRILVLV